jgi:hypothetical protein
VKIRIPSLPPRAQAACDRYLDWINVPIYSIGTKIEIRRIDILIFIAGIFCTAYYSFYSTPWWHGAILGGGMYLLAVMVALWFF